MLDAFQLGVLSNSVALVKQAKEKRAALPVSSAIKTIAGKAGTHVVLPPTAAAAALKNTVANMAGKSAIGGQAQVGKPVRTERLPAETGTGLPPPEQAKVINEEKAAPAQIPSWVKPYQVEAYKRLTAERGAPLMGGLTNWGGNQLKSLLWHMHPSLGLSVDKYDPTNLALGTAAGLYGLKKFMEPEQPNVYGGMSGMPRFGYY